MKKSILIALLLGMGVSKANAEKMAKGSPDDGDTMEQKDIDAMLAAHKEQQVALMENEPALIEKIQKSEKAKLFSEIERKLKQNFGLTSEDIKDKKIDEIIVLAKTKVTTNNDKTNDDLQKEILKLTNEKKKLEEEDIPKLKNETVLFKKNFDLKNLISKKVPTGDDKLRLPYETVLKLVNSDLFELYDLDLDDKGEPVLKVKGSDLKPKSKDGTKFLTLDEAIGSVLETHQALKKSNAPDDNKKRDKDGNIIVEKPAGGDDVIPDGKNKLHLSAAEQHLATLKAEDEARAKS